MLHVEYTMARFELIPYVFELARIHKGWSEKDGKFSMRYDEYPKYVMMFDELDENKQRQLVERVRSKNRS